MSTNQKTWILNGVRCKQCSICVSFCPAGCLQLGADGFPGQSAVIKCRHCGLCERWCPDFAIEAGGGVGAK